MKKSSFTIGLIIVVVICCIVGFNGCSTYNSLTTYSQELDQKWASVENQYQRRFDLIPNLVETVKGYAKHESETYEKVTQARAGLTQAYNQAKELQDATNDGQVPNEEAFNKYSEAQNGLNKALSIYVNAVREAYPDLKADTQFRDLQVQLEGTENRIATAREDYTVAVKDYNLKVKRFPGNVWAGIFGFDAKPQFKADAEAQHAPKVSF